MCLRLLPGDEHPRHQILTMECARGPCLVLGTCYTDFVAVVRKTDFSSSESRMLRQSRIWVVTCSSLHSLVSTVAGLDQWVLSGNLKSSVELVERWPTIDGGDEAARRGYSDDDVARPENSS